MRGQTLIETIVALTAGIVVVSTITIAVISALNNAQFSKNQNLATQYAQEGMEIVRQRKNSFNDLSAGNYCLDKGSSTFREKPGGGCGQNVDNFFVREITIEIPAPPATCNNQPKATVFVQWKDSKCTGTDFCNETRLVSCFSDFNVVPTP